MITILSTVVFTLGFPAFSPRFQELE